MSCCALALGLAAPPQARAADITWDGSESSDWFDGDNWVGDNVPVLNDSALFTDPNVTNQPVLDGSDPLYTPVDLGAGDVQVDAGLLSIQNAGELFDRFGFIGRDLLTTGEVTVTGENSLWENSDRLSVGDSGKGTLTIEDGGKVSNTSGYVGRASEGVGDVTVTGENSLWENSGNLFAGRYGNGTLTIEDGGTVSSSEGFIGRGSGGVGEVTVTGVGSLWQNTGNLTLGTYGNGTLNIEAGGKVSNSYGYVGRFGAGEVTVTGENSLWQNSGRLSVGEYSNGTLSIEDGGKVSSANGYVGFDSDGVGEVTVTGDGSLWNNSGDLTVARLGNGTLTIEDGGKVSNTRGYVGRYSGGVGAVTVTGDGSEWNNSYRLIVGDYGEATLDIENGGKVSGRHSRIGFRGDSKGEVTVTGDGSEWNNTVQLIVGDFAEATLDIENGGKVSGGHGFVGVARQGTGEVTVTGDGSEWTNNDQLTVGWFGTGTLTIAERGTVTVGGGEVVVTLAERAGSTGTLNIGAKPSETAKAPGTLNAAGLRFGEGTGTLNFNHTDESGDFEFAPGISGIGTINQLSGFTNLTGDSSGFTGATNINGGTLSVDNVLGGNVIVNGGRLEGVGQIGGLNMNGGTFAPGNSIGTMTVNGNFALRGGATFEVELDAAGNSDKAIVNGTVDLTGGILKVLAEAGNYAARTNYTIIENDGTDAVVGTFTSVTTNFAFLTPSVIYDGGDGNDVVLTLLRTVVPSTGGSTYLSFCSVANTRNQCNVAQALDDFPMDNPLFEAVLLQTAPGARQAFDALSGEVHASVAGTLVDDGRYAREAVMGRMMQAGHRGEALGNGGPRSTDQMAQYDDQAMRLGGAYDGKSLVDAPPEMPQSSTLAFWTQGYGAWGTFDGDGNAATAERDLGGFISGMDAQISGSWRVGLATGASFSDVSVDERYSSAHTQTYHLGGYVGGDLGGLALRAGGLWAWSEIETSRVVMFPGFFERQRADYDADTGQLFGEVAYPTQAMGIDLEPFGGFAFVSVETGGFRERGGPDASLRTSGFDQDVGYTTVGLRAAKTFVWGAMAVTPRIEAAWLHAFDDVTPDASLAFATTGIGFDVAGVPLAEDSALLDAGLDFAISERLSAGVSYTGQYADNVSDNGIKGRLTWLFN